MPRDSSKPSSQNNAELIARRRAVMPAGVGQTYNVFVDRAVNSEVWDVEGKRYVDFSGGIAVLNTGHQHPKVIAAVKAQLDKVHHTCFQVLAYEPYVELCERLVALAPGNFAKKAFLLTTGAEAVENAIKIARAATKRQAVIAFGGGFHGRTLLTMGLTGKVAPYKAGFGPFPAEIYHAKYPNAMHGVSVADAIASIEAIFKYDVEAERVAAIILEPVQGEGGFYVAPPEFVKAVRALCDQHGIVMIADEVQAGAGRTGTWLACEQWPAAPDLITMAKSIGGGFPISAVIGKAEIMDKPQPGGLGGTYAGSPIACAAALAVLDVFEEEDRLTELDLDDLFDAFDDYAERFVEDAKAADSEALAAVAVFDDEPELGRLVVRAALAVGTSDGVLTESEQAAVGRLCETLGIELKE